MRPEPHVRRKMLVIRPPTGAASGGAQAGERHVSSVDAAHCVCGSSLCRLWPIVSLFVREVSGRQRFQFAGPFDARLGVVRDAGEPTATLPLLQSPRTSKKA